MARPYLEPGESKEGLQVGAKAMAYMLAAFLHQSARQGRALRMTRVNYFVHVHGFDKFRFRSSIHNQAECGLYCLNCQRMYQIPKVGTYCLTCPNCSGILHGKWEELQGQSQVFQAYELLQLIGCLGAKEQTILWRLLKEFAMRRGDYVSL